MKKAISSFAPGTIAPAIQTPNGRIPRPTQEALSFWRAKLAQTGDQPEDLHRSLPVEFIEWARTASLSQTGRVLREAVRDTEFAPQFGANSPKNRLAYARFKHALLHGMEAGECGYSPLRQCHLARRMYDRVAAKYGGDFTAAVLTDWWWRLPLGGEAYVDLYKECIDKFGLEKLEITLVREYFALPMTTRHIIESMRDMLSKA